MAPRGNPPKLTPERQEKLISFIRDGNYLHIACAAAGISYKTYKVWMRRGIDEPESIYGAFRAEALTARRDCEIDLVKLWRIHAKEDWRAGADLLARRYPKRWARRDRMELTGKNGGPIRFSNLSDEALAQQLSQLESEAGRLQAELERLQGGIDPPSQGPDHIDPGAIDGST